MSQDPAASAAYRVPRSTLDDNYIRGESLPSSAIGTAIVVSVDGATVTVRIGDEVISGVVYLCDPPAVGDVVDLEARGDLIVIPCTGDLDTFLDDMEIQAQHIVSDDDPGKPPPVILNLGGSMKDLDAWQFLGTETAIWTRDLDPSGLGIVATEVPASAGNNATLWSDVDIEVDPGDVIQVDAHFTELVTDVTVQTVLMYSPDEDADPFPGDPDVVLVAYGTPVSVAATDTALSVAITVPPTLTFAVSGTMRPRTAKLGLALVGDGDSSVLISSLSAVQTLFSWPLGSLWMDTDADSGGLTTAVSSTVVTAGTQLPVGTYGTWYKMPACKKVAVTAPPASGGVLLVTATGSLTARTTATGVELRLVAASGTMQSTGARYYSSGVPSTIPYSISGLLPLDPGDYDEVTVEFNYTQGGGTPSEVWSPSIQAVFLPGGVMAGSPAKDANIRYWDGDSWRPPFLTPTGLNVSADGTVPPSGKSATTTTTTKPAGTAIHEGQSVTLSATVTAGATGTVSFSRSSSNDGPWTVIGSAAVSAGKATRSWPTVAGDWFIRAEYLGDATHVGSAGVTSSALHIQKLTTGTLNITSSWVQAYQGNNTKITGSGHDSAAQQGYYPPYNQRKSLIRFNTGPLPNDATVTNVVLVCHNWVNWQGGTKGTAVVGSLLTTTSVPNTWPAANTDEDRSRHAVDQAGWSANITSWADRAVVRSDFTGITLGIAPSQAETYQGRSADNADNLFELRITYQRWV